VNNRRPFYFAAAVLVERGVQQRDSDEETGIGYPGIGLGADTRPGVPAQIAVHGRGERRGARTANRQRNRGQSQARRRVTGVPPEQDMPENYRHAVGLADR